MSLELNIKSVYPSPIEFLLKIRGRLTQLGWTKSWKPSSFGDNDSLHCFTLLMLTWLIMIEPQLLT